jgi:hypothetical protein
MFMKPRESNSAMLLDFLNEENAFFCPITYESHIRATVEFAKIVRITDEDCAFDVRFFYRNEHCPEIESITRTISRSLVEK